MKMGKVFKDCSSAMALLKECSEILKTWQTAYTHLGEGIKVVEFVYKQNDDKLFFVEAKSSSPKPSGAEFKKYIEDISKKFVHSFDLWLSMNLKRRQDDISEEILDVQTSSQIFRFILVIKGHEKSWLPPVMEDQMSVLNFYQI